MDVTQIPELVARTAYPLSFDAYEQVPKLYPEICEVLPVPPELLFGERVDTVLGVGEPDKVPYGAEMPEREGDAGWKVYLKVYKLGEKMRFARELVESSDAIGRITGLISEFATSMGTQIPLKKERIIADIFQKGTLSAGSIAVFDNSFPNEADPYPTKIYDNTPFFNATHALKVGSATPSNYNVSNALTLVNLEAGHTLMAVTSAVDERGDPMLITPDTLLVPSGAMGFTASTLLESMLKPGSANNDANTMRGKYRLLEWRFLTDSASSAAWWLLQTGPGAKRAVRVRDSGAPQFETWYDPATQSWFVQGYSYFGASVQEWRTAQANNKAAS
jgi:hypothetical protein